MDLNIIYRSEEPGDENGITRVNDLAFGQVNEGRMIEALRKKKTYVTDLSLVAVLDGSIIGHILFFPVHVRRADGSLKKVLSLAPLSVIPKYQNRGIGGILILKGLKKSKALGYRGVVVLGHADYYPRFGFTKASEWGIYCPFHVPDATFMAIELTEGALDNIRGTVVFPPEYNED